MGTTTGRRLPCVKYTLFGSNLVFTVVGFLILALGVWLKTSPNFRYFLSEEYRRAVGDTFWEANTLYVFDWLLILLGAVMVVVCVTGFCAAIKEASCLLITYFCALFLVFCFTVGSGSLLLYRKDAVRNEVNDAMIYMVQHYYQGPEIIRQAADQLQTTFRCCGNSGCGDYHMDRLDQPRSCDISCDGCGERIYRALRIGFTITGTVFAVVIVCQVLGMALSLYLCCWGRGLNKRILRYGDISVANEPPAAIGPGPPPKQIPPPSQQFQQGFSNPLAASQANSHDDLDHIQLNHLGPGPPPPYAYFAPKHPSHL